MKRHGQFAGLESCGGGILVDDVQHAGLVDFGQNDLPALKVIVFEVKDKHRLSVLRSTTHHRNSTITPLLRTPLREG